MGDEADCAIPASCAPRLDAAKIGISVAWPPALPQIDLETHHTFLVPQRHSCHPLGPSHLAAAGAELHAPPVHPAKSGLDSPGTKPDQAAVFQPSQTLGLSHTIKYMPPTRSRARMKEGAAKTPTVTTTQVSEPLEPPPAPRANVVTAPSVETTSKSSPTSEANSKAPSRRVLRLKCPVCSDYPDGFRSEHELRRHTNRVHKKARKVWVTIDTSPDKSFLANCKACQTGKRYNECYNAASHLRRMHFHPHKRGERKMTAAEARRGGKPGDLDPPMDVLKANWLREVDEILGDDNDSAEADVASSSLSPPRTVPPQLQQPTASIKTEGKAPPTPTTPSTRSMAIDSIVDKMDAS
ncbi:hypothetical protein PTT_15853 [Pyrenophora teres f. teres 0-1]|uniref:DUF7896 domain-containing protein n=2 Tax=Pyrenophora teres f. teres TaxID=97479 RepID=E3S138_PYRTT|nr:hypothetical protein PTT_15853 [Pyrenophora teres f. teres 0-1]